VNRVLDAMAGDPRYVREIRQSQLEIVTGVAGNATAAGLNLARARLDLIAAVGDEIAVAAAGTHPTCSDWGDIAEGDRYEMIADEYGLATEGSIPCGFHVHVAVPGADRALAVYNSARSFLPEIGAIGANSPFLDGRDTGLACSRRALNDAFHRSGVPPAFATWDAFVGFVRWGQRGRLFPDFTHFWWDLRPHLRHGTLELRVSDTQTRVDDAAAVAAVFQSLVSYLVERYDSGDPLPVHDTVKISENSWRAARYGIRGFMVDLVTGERRETREHILRLLDMIGDHAVRLGNAAALLVARALLADNGAERQRYVHERGAEEGLLRWLVDETHRSAEDLLSRRA
jgi:carboxylate-amine ligase